MINVDTELDIYYFTLQLRDDCIPFMRKGFIFKLPMCDVILKNNMFWKIKFKSFYITCNSRNCINGIILKWYNAYAKYILLKKMGLITDLSKLIIELLL